MSSPLIQKVCVKSTSSRSWGRSCPRHVRLRSPFLESDKTRIYEFLLGSERQLRAVGVIALYGRGPLGVGVACRWYFGQQGSLV